MITVNEIGIPSSDGKHTLKGVMYIPDTKPVCALQIAHGMTEYIERYDDFMRFFSENGILCFGFNHLGHKGTSEDGELGFFAHRDGWKLTVNDTYLAGKNVKDTYPDIPLFLLGHSMGSFIARLTASEHKDIYAGLIVSGTAGENPVASIGIALAEMITALYGDRHFSPFLENMAFGKYNEKFGAPDGKEWLTTDKDIVNKYVGDKYCMFHFTSSALADLIKLNKNCNTPEWFSSFDKNMPVYIYSGSDDPVGDYGKGPAEVSERLKNAGVHDVTLKIYDGLRHETHNEIIKKDVYSDVLSWITSHTI